MVDIVEGMPKEERKEAILEFFYERDATFTPAVLHFNLEEHLGIFWSQETTKRYLSELVEEGKLENVEDERGYYRITDAGRQQFESSNDI